MEKLEFEKLSTKSEIDFFENLSFSKISIFEIFEILYFLKKCFFQTQVSP